MPWSNVPKEKWPQMERCVNDLKAKGKSEESANAICYTSIMGDKKKVNMPAINVNINLNGQGEYSYKASLPSDDGKVDNEEEIEEEGGEEEMTENMEKAVWTTAFVNSLPDSSFAYISEGGKKDSEGKTVPRSLRHLPYKDASGKPDAAHVRNALARLSQTDIPSEAKASAKAKLESAAKELGIKSSDETKINANEDNKQLENYLKGGEEKMQKQEDEAQEMKDCVAKYVKAGKSEAEAAKQCKIDLKGEEEGEPKKAEKTGDLAKEEVSEEAPVEEVAEEVPAEEAVATEEKEEVTAADPVGDLLKQVLGKVEEIQASLKKEDDSVAAEGVAPTPAEGKVTEEAPKEEVVVETPVEEASEDASAEGTDKIAKVNDSLTKIADSIADLAKRVNALEEQPAPSKVVSPKVVTKGETPEDSSPRLTEIKEELSELEEMKNKNVEQYQKERAWERAFDLIAERDQLKG